MSGEEPLIGALPAPAADGFAALRARAHRRLLEQGLPSRRIEAYKYTDLTPLGAEAWPRATSHNTAVPGELPPQLGSRLLWVDGRLHGEPAGDAAQPLEEHLDSPEPRLVRLLGRSAPEDDAVLALNTALFDHGAWIDVGDGEARETPLELVFAAGARDAAAATHARLAVRLGRGSRLVLIERHLGAPATALATRVCEIVLEAGADLLHVRLNEAGPGTWQLGHTAVHAGEGARYRSIGLDLGARLAREAARVELAGAGAAAELAGLAVLDGRRHADVDALVAHSATDTRSRQYFRGVLDGRSRGAYTGRVRVAPGAQKSDAAQESANLLLSPRAEADTRPQLEIYADDVACSHGAATGAIDPDALFYLQSRGVSATDARRMIAFGFALKALAMVRETALYRPLAALLAERMQTDAEADVWQ